MKKISLLLLLYVFSWIAYAAPYQEGKEYTKLAKPVANVPEVVEFFSFYCPACDQFANVYKVGEAIDEVLPKGVKVVKYHASFLGPLGKELTHAWSIAMALEVEKQVEKPLFDALIRKRALNSEQDIRQVFIDAGIKAEEYDSALESFVVKSITAKQQNALKDFEVSGTPSFYVAGKYHIKNDGMSVRSVDGYRKEYADVVKSLLTSP